jgi:3-(3-hydroxy-phenyl)propionate hydroxylase
VLATPGGLYLNSHIKLGVMPNSEPDIYDVAVVGYGPVGAVAANLLGQRGIRAAVLDRTDQLFPLPRAIAFDHEVMRVFQNIGVAARITDYIRPYPPSEYRGVDGRAIARFDAIPPPYPLGWAPAYLFVQPPVEAAIRNVARTHESLAFFLDAAVTGLVEDSEAQLVRINVRSSEGKERQLFARYVIGCDGGASTVRRLAGIELESLDFDEPWLVVDVIVDDDEALNRLPQINIQYCEPSRPCTYVVGAGRHRRWELMLLPDEDPERIDTSALINRLLSRWLAPGSARMWRAAAYVFHALIARRWRSGRVFLMGDAAHQTPPFLAQGMCQGIRDAANLAWKLAFVLEKRAGDALLETYEAERSPHVRQTTEIARKLGRIICERDLAAAMERDCRLRAESGDPPRVTIRQDFIPPLRAGLVASIEPAGRIFPQPWVTLPDGRDGLLDDFTGMRFRLMIQDMRSDEIPPRTHALIQQLDGVIVEIGARTAGQGKSILAVKERDNLAAEWFARHNVRAALVRPDHYVFGAAADGGSLEHLTESLEAAIG